MEPENTTFDLELYPVREGTEFRVRDEPGEVERAHIIDEETSGLLVQVDLSTIVHGRNSDRPATLIGIIFHFSGVSSKRRFRQVQISIRFEDEKKRVPYDPEVVKLWPQGDVTLNTAEATIENTKAISGSFTVGATCMSGNLGWTQEPYIVHRKKDRTYLFGAKRIEGRNYGKRNTVRLKLFENEAQESGVITELRTAILLNRKSDDRFLAHVMINATADLVHSAKKITKEPFRTSQASDPIMFDPSRSQDTSLEPTGIDIGNLGTEFEMLVERSSTMSLPTTGEAISDKNE
ncbi:hypothetical protein ONZ43_g81 [Nemania bipapillata]|uniref:Uncharacterized protein n=1 Tax=Nemania bipapillata TaxID=110536 RepID=A0ACC2J9R2_9PEZI|nr:hypothetical protein ONZ43_g81 [Nemania bipapillata]